eukprot:224468_1
MASIKDIKDIKHREFRAQYKGKNKFKPHLPQSHLPSLKSQNINSLPDESWGKKVYLYRGSIVDDEITDDIDAVVNPANERLWADDSGVCGVIFNSAGYESLQNDCNEITSRTEDNSIPNGQTAVTNGYSLNVNHIYHTVAPCEQNTDDLIACYYSALESCVITGDRSIAIPCIGTGDGSFSKHNACSTALRAVKDWLLDGARVKYKDFMQGFEPQKWQNKITDDQHIYIDQDETVADRIDHIVFCCYDQENWDIYKAKITQVYPSPHGAHSFVWIERMKYSEYENEIALLKQRIQRLELEKANDDMKEDTKSDVCTIEAIFNELEEEQKHFLEIYDKEQVSQRIESFAEQRFSINKAILGYSECLKKMEETVHGFSDKVQEMKEFISTVSIPDTMNYKQWNVDDILLWILSLEDGKFASYIEAFKAGLIASEITSGETLPELTRSDLSVPPFSIHSFHVKRELVKHFSGLKTDMEGSETL